MSARSDAVLDLLAEAMKPETDLSIVLTVDPTIDNAMVAYGPFESLVAVAHADELREEWKHLDLSDMVIHVVPWETWHGKEKQ